MAVAELGAARRHHAGDRRRAAGRALAGVGRIEVGLVEERRHARPGDLQRRRHEHRLGGLAGRHVALQEAVGQRLEIGRRGRGERRAGLQRPARAGRLASILLEDARQRHAPALVAPPGRGIERRAWTASPWRSRPAPAARPAAGRPAPRAGRPTRAAIMRRKPSSSWPRPAPRSRSARLAKTVARSGSLTGSLSAISPSCFRRNRWMGRSGRCSGLADFLAEPLAMVLPGSSRR